ncbi:MAG: hypothetical protein ACE5NN_06995 [Candidatus Bathyarchaeia archaeon]
MKYLPDEFKRQYVKSAIEEKPKYSPEAYSTRCVEYVEKAIKEEAEYVEKGFSVQYLTFFIRRRE